MNIISDTKIAILNPIINELEINVSNVKIAGSFLTLEEDYGDIDLFVNAGDHITLAKLLHYGSGHPIYHIIPIPSDIFNNLHQYMSWNQCCMTYCLDGVLHIGDSFTNDSILSFNAKSLKYFNTFANIMSAGSKLTNHGFQLYKVEEWKILYYIQVMKGKPQVDKDLTLSEIAIVQLGETLSQMIADENGIVAGGYFRDIINNKQPKDMDIFIPSSGNWESLCNDLSDILEEIDFLPSGQKSRNVNLRKFKLPNSNTVLDVISYNFVTNKEHIVETFDFSINCLWSNLRKASSINGGLNYTAEEIISHITDKKLIVGGNMWFKAGTGRALMRWERFRKEGYIADAENCAKYSRYVKMINNAHTE